MSAEIITTDWINAWISAGRRPLDWRTHLGWYRRGITSVLPVIPVVNVIDTPIMATGIRAWYRKLAIEYDKVTDEDAKVRRGKIVSDRRANPVIIEDEW